MLPLYPQKVKLIEPDHRYFDDDGFEYMSFSRLFGFMKDEFKKNIIAAQTAFSRGVDKSEVLQEWNAATELGLYYDRAIQEVSDNPMMIEKYGDIRDIIEPLISSYDHYYQVHNKVILHNEYYRIAGEADRLMLTSGRKDGHFSISDIKCFAKGTDDLYKYRGWFNAPFSHLPASKFSKISFQVSVYAFMTEELLGKKCRELFIHLINPVSRTHQKIHVPYLKNDVLIFLEYNRERILSNLVDAGVVAY